MSAPPPLRLRLRGFPAAVRNRPGEPGEDLRRGGRRVSVIMVTGTDFGTQSGLFISPASYRKLYQPFHRRVNDWIHEHTPWKTFIHSCGSVIALLPDLIEAGFDVLNPVQCSAVGMDPRVLKDGSAGS